MDITSDRQLYAVLKEQVLTPMTKSLTGKILDEVRQFIFENSPISSTTIRKYATYEMTEDADGILSTIYINDDGMQSEEQKNAYGSFSKFMSFGFKTKWEGDGMSIAYHMVEWLEETGAKGAYGNNPFQPIHMFQSIYEKLETEFPKWISQYARQIGIEIVRG